MGPAGRRIVQNRDIVVIGASAGGVEAMRRLARELPGDLPAAVFAVVHTSAGAPGALPEILDAAGGLRAQRVIDGGGDVEARPGGLPRELREKQTAMGSAVHEQSPSIFTCPDCHGALWAIKDGDLTRFRCHIGHSFSSRAPLAAESEQLEQALSSALRAHKERTELLRRMTNDAEATGRAIVADAYRRRAAQFEADAEIIQRMLSRSTAPDLSNDEEAA